MTYKDYKWEIYNRWLARARSPDTCPKNIVRYDRWYGHVRDGTLCLVWGRQDLLSFEMWETHEYEQAQGKPKIQQNIIRHMPNAPTQQSEQKLIGGSELEIRSLLLMARAFCDKEAIEVLEGFLQIERSSELEYTYLFSERYPHPE